MKLNFGQLKQEVFTQLGYDKDTTDENLIFQVARRVNQAISYIWNYYGWEFRKDRFYVSTKEPISGGTCTVTKGSTLVTLSSPIATNYCKLGYLVVNSKHYKIDPLSDVTTTTFHLVTPYDGETDAVKFFKIIFPEVPLDSRIDSVISSRWCGKEIPSVDPSRFPVSTASTGVPQVISVKTSDFTYYSEGTVSVEKGSRTVTGYLTNFEADMQGMPFILEDSTQEYTIHKVISATELTLKNPYKGESFNGKNYQILPQGSLMLQVYHSPQDVYTIELECLTKIDELVNNNEIPEIPVHDVILQACMWLGVQDVKDANPVRIQQARSDFEKAIKQLSRTYRVFSNSKWKSQAEVRDRRSSWDDFNPLNL